MSKFKLSLILASGILSAVFIFQGLNSPAEAQTSNWGACTNGVCYTGGRVGIGTLSPGSGLDVSGNFQTRTAYGGASFVVAPNSGSSQKYGMTNLDTGTLFFGRTTGAGGGVSPDLSLFSGNVGVNKAYPGTNLDVNGFVRSNPLNNGGATYVVTPSNGTAQSYGMTAADDGTYFFGRTNGPSQGILASIKVYSNGGMCLGKCW
ncbi:hypothetical protein JW978_04155 [Candidatus Dojkabacteria bacterium]|nr:hypothetical protein [Candidatus Dojkabacteria bacterium]